MNKITVIAKAVQTDAEFLRQAMEEAKGFTFDGEMGDYGFTLYTKVNIITQKDTSSIFGRKLSTSLHTTITAAMTPVKAISLIKFFDVFP